MDLSFFLDQDILHSGKQFFEDILGLTLVQHAKSEILVKEFLEEQLTDEALLDKVSEARIIGIINDKSIVGKEQTKDVDNLLENNTDDYDMLIVFGMELKEGIIPSKSDISRLTRAVNRRSASRPVVLLTKYSDKLTFSAAERGQPKKKGQKGEKIGRISILRDIDLIHDKVHAGHERILLQLRINPLKVTNFKELYDQWLEVFNISILNKEFYNELFTWYLWATRTVTFPKKGVSDIDSNVYTSESVIRLLTRLIFVWFVKEKRLIPETLFNRQFLTTVIKNFNPVSSTNSDYYKAILQNLFFATLNTEMPKDGGSRQFLDEAKRNIKTGYTDEYLDHLAYRYKELFIDPHGGLKLFEDVPFLNGGLFECLDKWDPETYEEIRIDGFSSKTKNQPIVPNILFFGSTNDLDLSNEFGDGSRHEHSKARGIINILNSYKFTIEENTPIEQEIALDPELLGKIFENLLASYNPETRTTVRKQTGSYYTPREIVNYMVDESLISYLKSKLTDDPKAFQQIGNPQINLYGNEYKKGQLDIQIELAASKWSNKKDKLEEKLHELFAYECDNSPFKDDSQTTKAIIAHLSDCKILDPACGSGAFLMGILHKIVFALGKLDPCNYTWKQAQLEKARRDRHRAEQFEDDKLRSDAIRNVDEKIEYIKSSFGETGHELDYTRKLFLIENCIYGIDIQQVGIQISKLRFFISLMVDQRLDKSKINNNILSLPNLETKFVAANTLVPIEKPIQGTLISMDLSVNKIEYELHEIRQKIFFTRKWKDKKMLKKLEFLKRQDLKNSLLTSGFPSSSAGQVASWDPFDQLHFAPFFDRELMFSLTNGFNIIVGNPPYVRADNPAIAKQREIILNTRYYETLWEKWDLMVPFFERSLKMLEPRGILTFIASNSITTSKYAEKLQDWIIRNHFVKSIDYFEDIEVFEAGVIPVVVSILAQRKGEWTKKIYRRNHFEHSELVMLDNNAENLKSKVFRKNFSDLFKPTIPSERLGDLCYMSKGMVTNSDEKTAQGEFVKDDLISDLKDEIHCREYVEGKNINAYNIDKIRYIEYNTERVPGRLSRPTFRDLYTGDKILRGRVTKGTFDNTGIVCNDSIIVFKRFCDLKNVDERSISVSISKNNFETQGSKTPSKVKKRRIELEQLSESYLLKYILAVINSSYAMAYLNNYRRHRLENYFYPDDFRNFPLPKIELPAQEAFVVLADYMLYLRNINNQQVLETVPNEHIAQFFETVINGCVYELFFPDYMKEKEIDLLRYVEKEINPINGKLPDEVISSIKKTYELWRENKSQVRNRLLLFASRSQEIIMKIENG